MTNSPLLFLDWDGVLNEFGPPPDFTDPHRWFKPECIRQLDRIIDATDAAIVVSSTCRGYVHDGTMTARGIGVILRTHGFRNFYRIISVTPEGELRDRGWQIRKWLRDHELLIAGALFAAIDDMDPSISSMGIPLVQTNGSVGLTAEDADKVIAILKGESR